MKITQLPIFVILFCFSITLQATPYSPSPTNESVETIDKKAERKIDREVKKQIRAKKKSQKRITKFKKKLAKWKNKMSENEFFGGASDHPKFRMGLLLLLGGLALALVGSLLGISIFNWLGGVVGLVGIIFLVLGLLDYAS